MNIILRYKTRKKIFMLVGTFERMFSDVFLSDHGS